MHANTIVCSMFVSRLAPTGVGFVISFAANWVPVLDVGACGFASKVFVS